MENKYGLKVGMIILMQADVEAAVAFYEKLDLKKKFHLKGQWAELLLGDVKIGLCPTSEQVVPHHTGIVLEVADLYTTYNALKEQGIEFLSEPKAPEHGIMVSIKDPGNNIIDLYQPTPERIQEIVQSIKEKDKKCCSDKADCSKKGC